VIRFGVVLAIVMAALGLLVGGVLTSSLLLVYLAIGVSALAAVLLVVGVVIWRDEIFNDAAAGPAAADNQPTLAAAGSAAAQSSGTASRAGGTRRAGATGTSKRHAAAESARALDK